MRQCKAKYSSGEPCRREAAPDSDFCTECNESNARNLDHRAASIYDLSVGRELHNQLRSHKDVLALEDEVALSRQLVQRKWNSAEDEFDLIANSVKLSDLLVRVKDVVVAANSLKMKRGELLDQHRVVILAERLIQAVNEGVLEHIPDEELSGDILKTVAGKFLEVMKEEL